MSVMRVAVTVSFIGLLGTSGCGGVNDPGVVPAVSQEAICNRAPAVGLALEIENGVGMPLSVKAGQSFYINQIDLRAFIDTATDEGVAGLKTTGAAASLPWGRQTAQVDEEPVLLPNPDNTFTRRRFFRKATWMDAPSLFLVEQLDANGRRRGWPVIVSAGTDRDRRRSDDFFVRRLRAIQWTNDCPAPNDCTGAKSFQEEALVELRDAQHPERTFDIDATTTSLRVIWTLDPHHPYSIPVTQVANPTYAYGFDIEVKPLTAAQSDGTYAPGTSIDFQLTLKDGAGTALHAPGTLPSYFEAAVLGINPAGINYYRAFFDPSATYYRRKHRERNFTATLIGPMQKNQPMRSVLEVPQFFAPTQVVATRAVDGIYGEAVIFPQSKLFQGAFDPSHATWFEPASDTWTFHVPPDAEAGTYQVSIKARRTYLGEDIPHTTTIEIQVGSNTHTSATLNTGGCNACHKGGGAFTNILHADADRSTCAGCHAPLAIELEGPIYVRTHFLHSRSNRVDAPLDHCAMCHTTKAGIQRTSKSACLSCHKSYPDSHVAQYGPITSMYIGDYFDPAASFAQCSTTCHTNHPNSGL